MNTNKKTLEDAVKHVVNYYGYFKYAPSLDELYTFLPTQITQQKLKSCLDAMVRLGQLKNFTFKIKNSPLYTLPPYSIYAKQKESKKEASERKIRSISLYLRVVYLRAPIMLMGLSGSVAMLDAESSDDIDLFIIAKQNRMWTARLWCLFFATLFGLRRRRGVRNASNKVCLNLFYDERELMVPEYKQNEYTAHEVLQMKPVYEKNNMYAKFLKANDWVKGYFPNADTVILAKAGIYENKNDYYRSRVKPGMTNYLISDFVEYVFKKIQLLIIKRHQTTEIITPTQLWFYPHDFEKKLKEKRII